MLQISKITYGTVNGSWSTVSTTTSGCDLGMKSAHTHQGTQKEWSMLSSDPSAGLVPEVTKVGGDAPVHVTCALEPMCILFALYCQCATIDHPRAIQLSLVMCR